MFLGWSEGAEFHFPLLFLSQHFIDPPAVQHNPDLSLEWLQGGSWTGGGGVEKGKRMEQMQVTFENVFVSFSQEEWEYLDEEQKELWREVMHIGSG
ncbi:zinc finger protein 132-like [Microcaecilia unicolor]|uniref:Zinc finger protein 132-like n=1 Tax=Microcaecilia unicolor TaxID=1415580 RepID=A0A6P7WT66_9AMPH|nr:zinc finger protein 132-like [Microcaecilia unicolor]